MRDTKLNYLKNTYKLPEKDIKKLRTVDPTKTGIYTNWLCRLVKSSENNNDAIPLITGEDKEKIQGLLGEFTKLKKSPTFDKSKNIMDYKNVADLFDVVDQSSGQKSNKDKYREAIEDGAEIVYCDEKNNVNILRVFTAKAASNLAHNTNWCTINEDTAADYLKKDYLWVWTHKGKSLIQAHRESESILDRKDSTVEQKFVDQYTGLFESIIYFIEELGPDKIPFPKGD